MSEHVTRSPAETTDLGESTARNAPDGAVILLYGNLGSGKTTFTKGVGRGLGCGNWQYIRSPSFTIINEHEGSGGKLYHIDLYRLGGKTEIEDLGMRDFMGEKGSLTVVEWAEKLGGPKSEDIIHVKIEDRGGSERLFRIEKEF